MNFTLNLHPKLNLLFEKRQFNILITYIVSLVSFYTLWKYQETRGFLLFWGTIERDLWYETDLKWKLFIVNVSKCHFIFMERQMLTWPISV